MWRYNGRLPANCKSVFSVETKSLNASVIWDGLKWASSNEAWACCFPLVFDLCFLFLDAVQDSTVGGPLQKAAPSHSKLESRVKAHSQGLYQDLLQFSSFLSLWYPVGMVSWKQEKNGVEGVFLFFFCFWNVPKTKKEKNTLGKV